MGSEIVELTICLKERFFMNFKIKKQIFSYRKVKGYGLASAVIASMFLAQGVVSADVVDNGNGTTTLSNDKASIVVKTSKFKEDNVKTATELFNEGAYEPEVVNTGKDTVTDESKTVVSYETESGTKLKEDVTKTSSEEKQLDYKVEGSSGKQYTGTDTTTSTVTADLGKEDTIETNGEKYEYVRTEITQGKETVLTETRFNDVNTKVSVEGMHNEDGSIKYDKIKNGSRVWVLEEKEDGTYGKYTLIENAQNLTDDQIREAAKTATSTFSKAEVDAKGGLKDTDSIVVYETTTYAARKQTSEQFGKDFYYKAIANSSKFKKSYIDEIYKVGLEGLEKREDSYYYKGKEVVTIEDFKKNVGPIPEGGTEADIPGYMTDFDNKYYFDFANSYIIPTTYYDVLSAFFISHPDSLIFKGKSSEVFWGANDEERTYFNKSFVAKLLNDSLKSKYGLTESTEDFTDKQLESFADNARPTEKKTYSFAKSQLNGDEKTFDASVFKNQSELWKHEIGLSYSEENVEKVRNWIKGSQSLLGKEIVDPFNGKESSSVTKQEYINAVFDNISNDYLETVKDSFSNEQIRELRSKFGDLSFTFVGSYLEREDIDKENSDFVFRADGSKVYRNSLGVVTENTETFTYHDVITPLRAYRLTADNNLVRHIYKLAKPVFELPNDAPVHDKPEFDGGVIPNEAPIHDKPEFDGGVIPNEAPIHDKPEFDGGVIPNEAPVHDKPEFDGGVIPNEAPIHDKPEFDGGVIPNEAPILEKPELKIPEKEVPTPEVPTSETPVAEVEKPSQPVAQKPQEKFVTKELPNTGTEVSQRSSLGILGLVSSLGLLGFVNKRKKTEDKD